MQPITRRPRTSFGLLRHPFDIFRRVFLAVSTLAVLAGPALAQMLDAEMPMTDGTVRAITRLGDTLYLGGRFQYAGPFTGGLAGIDATTGALLPEWPRVVGDVRCAIPDGAGGWYLGGSFTSVGGFVRLGLAHVLADRSVSPWDPGAVGGVKALALRGTTLYVGGQINTLAGKLRWNCGAVDAETGAILDWYPGGGSAYDDEEVAALTVSGSTVFIGGRFRGIGGQSRASLAAVDAVTGLATSWTAHCYSDVQNSYPGLVTHIVVKDSTVYVAGEFTAVLGDMFTGPIMSRNGLAAIDLATAEIAEWDPASNGPVYSLWVGDSVAYVGGAFSEIGGQPRLGIAAISRSSALATPWNPGEQGEVQGLLVSGSTVYASGVFGRIGGQDRRNFAALDLVTGAADAWNPRSNGSALGMAKNGSTLLAWGWFSSVGGFERNNLAAIDADTRRVLDWNPAPNGQVLTLAAADATVYVGGTFRTIGGANRPNIAAVDATTGLATAWNPQATALPSLTTQVTSLAVDGSTVYAAGYFLQIGGQTRHRLAALDRETGLATSWRPTPTGVVLSLCISDTTLYAGGSFASITGQARGNLASFGLPSGVLTEWNPGADQPVFALAVGGGTVYAGGSFTNCGGLARPALAAIDATSGVASTWNARASGTVYSLALDGNTLFVGGSFGAIGGQNRYNLGAVSTTTGLATAWNPEASGQVYALSVGDARLHVGGSFTRVGSWPVPRRAGFASYLGLADVTPPTVRVISPNGHETFFVGERRELRWAVTDDVGVNTMRIEISRTGPEGPWDLLYWGVEPVGSRDWLVTGPTVNDDVYLRVEATDFSDHVASDISDVAFSISDQSVPTLVELFRAIPVEGGVRVEWRSSDANAFRSIALECAPAQEGPWTSVTAERSVSEGLVSVLDSEADVEGERWYRLRGVGADGRLATLGLISVRALERIAAFELSPVTPNPSSGRALVSFALPVRSFVRLSITDVQGRERVLLHEAQREAGRHTLLLNAEDLPPGIYFLRLRTSGASLTRRVHIVR